MGVPCCRQVDYQSVKFRGDLYKIQAFQQAEMPNDPAVQQWLSQNQNKTEVILATEEHQKQKQKQKELKKVLRLKQSDTYFYCCWLNSLAEGKGFVFKPNTIFISAYFKQGLPQGKAIVKFLNQSFVYEGDVKGWRAHGNGVLINNKNNYKVSGYWQNSRVKNAMINFFSDPNISSIQIDTFEEGKGNISYKDGRWYQGSINTKRLCPHGEGKVNFPFQSSKQSYDGQWYNGKMLGKGKLLYRNKQLYEGQFFNSLRQGFGKFTFTNGDYYEGYWKNGRQDGVGLMYTKLQQVTKYGIWQNGKYKKQLDKSKYLQLSQLQKSKQSKGPLQDINQGKNHQLSSSRVSQYPIKLTESRVG